MSDLQLFHKPSGISTHSPSTKSIEFNKKIPGFIETLSQQLYICQRLDKDTSGALILAKTTQAATYFTEKLQTHQVKKEYYLITDKIHTEQKITVKGYIQKSNSSYSLNNNGKESQFSETIFTYVKTTEGFYLWKAQPITGKTHQIRLHAQKAGIPILGDSLYSGTPHCRLFLHCHQVSLETKSFTSPLPHLMENLSLLKNRSLSIMISSLERRLTLYPNILKKPSECIRLIHSEHPTIRCDRFGPHLWFYWYGTELPKTSDLDNCKYIYELWLKTHNYSEAIKLNDSQPSWFLRMMLNRGKHPNQSLLWKNGLALNQNEIPSFNWIAQENDISYEFRTQSGLSPGLFLDQRTNRNWVKENSANQKVLNLFAYTSGFSLSAAKGHAKEVVTVDLSKNFIEWSQKNFSLNKLPTSSFEFWTSDSLQYLKGCIKRNRKFDLIICDPPTFSRNGKEVFHIERKHEELTKLLIQCLQPKGRILFCNNYEKWSKDDFLNKTLRIDSHIKQTTLPYPNWDYEMPGQTSVLKSFLFEYKP